MTEEAVLLVLDYDRVCRICLKTQGVLSPLFDNENTYSTTDVNNEDLPPLHIQLEVITGVWIANLSNLPQKICHKCRYLVEMSYNLRKLALKANELLMESLDVDISTLAEDLQSKSKRGLGEKDSDDQETSYIIPEIAEEEEYVNIKRENLLKGDQVEQFLFYEKNTGDIKTEGSGDDSTEDQMKSDQDNEKQRRSRLANKRQKNESLKEPRTSSNREQRSKDLVCEICLTNATDQNSFFEHVSVHYRDTRLTPYYSATKPFACQQCNQNFNFKKDLIIHHRFHLNINPYTCKYEGCYSGVRSKEALRHHMYSHMERRFICEICGSAFKRKFELGQHSLRHKEEGSEFQCSQCRVVCKNSISYKAHLRHHQTGKRFQCKRIGCPKAFFSKTDLMIHERAHSNDKCFKCPLCVCAYISQSQLNRHLRQHEKRKINKCDKCSESFSDYTEFCNHRINTHGEWHPYKCKGCNQGYQSERQLERHMSRCKLSQKVEALSKQYIGDKTLIKEETEETNVENEQLGRIQLENIEIGDQADQLTENNGSFRYVAGQDALSPDNETQYMIIEEDGNSSVEQYICKALI